MHWAFVVLAVISVVGCSSKTTGGVNVCDSNPCTQAHRERCVDEVGQARCLCNSGYLTRPNGSCEEVTSANCPEHGGDSAEPDDCITRARALSAGDTKTQSIDPTGDYDYFSFQGAAGSLYSVSAQGSGTLMPRIDVFDQGGIWLGSEENVEMANLGFKAKATALYSVRVSHSPMDPSPGFGSYTLTATLLGPDDHGDGSDAATAVTPAVSGTTATPTTGSLEVTADQDWFSFPGLITHRYRLDFDAAKVLPAVAMYKSVAPNTPSFTSQQARIEFDVSSNDTHFLRLYSSGPVGPYSFTLTRIPK